MQQTNTKEITIDEIRDCFWSRIESILAEKGCKTRREQAEMLGVAVNTRDNWKNKLNSPDYYTIVRIAHKLNVSIDYLIDPTVSIRTPDVSIRAASSTTGLSEETIELLIKMKKASPSEIAALDAVLRNSARITPIGTSIAGLVGALSDYFKAASEKNNIAVPDGPVVVVPKELSLKEELAQFAFWKKALNLLDGPDRGTLLGLYADKLNELTNKGGSDNGNSKTDNH